MKNGLVSIMMPAYNAEAYIHQAIDSVIAQSYPHWELIIVDDGSKDRTAEIVSTFEDSRVKLIRQENGGEAVARNTALQQMAGEWVAFLDADDAFLPDHLSSAVSALQQHPNRDGVYTDGYYINSEGEQLKTLSSQRRGPFEGDIFEQIVRASDVFGPPICVVLRRAPIDEKNIEFDPRIIIGPDWDFLTRVAEFTRFSYVDQPTCLYRVHTTNITVRTNRQKRAESLTVCREKAIHLSRFPSLSTQTRYYAFYDLLVNLLPGRPDQQNNILMWQEFRALETADQARLLRLMASREVARGGQPGTAHEWLKTSRRLNPKDLKALALSLLLGSSPRLYQWLLRLRAGSLVKQADTNPFGDLG